MKSCGWWVAQESKVRALFHVDDIRRAILAEAIRRRTIEEIKAKFAAMMRERFPELP